VSASEKIGTPKQLKKKNKEKELAVN